MPDDVTVGAVRVSANGWEAAVLEGLEVLLVCPIRCNHVGDGLSSRRLGDARQSSLHAP